MESPLLERVRKVVTEQGFEAYQFKVGWYNDVVDQKFHLSYDYNTLAILLISLPDMFELNFIPFLKSSEWAEDSKDPLDQSIQQYVSHLKETVLTQCDMDIYYDYEMDPRSRRPRMLMQTAGHVSAAAYLYQQSHISHLIPQEEAAKKFYPVSIHPIYGGWFAFRTVLILRDTHLPADEPQVQPIDSVPADKDRFELLKLFNNHWQDGRYRDINNPRQRYSSLQQQYFVTAPKDRSEVVKHILEQSS